jgi:hypothetical protein
MKARVFMIICLMFLVAPAYSQDYVIIQNDGYTQRMTADDLEYEQRRIIRQELERAERDREIRQEDAEHYRALRRERENSTVERLIRGETGERN